GTDPWLREGNRSFVAARRHSQVLLVSSAITLSVAAFHPLGGSSICRFRVRRVKHGNGKHHHRRPTLPGRMGNPVWRFRDRASGACAAGSVGAATAPALWFAPLQELPAA